MESKLLLTTYGIARPTPIFGSVLFLGGTVRGQYSRSVAIPDAGATYEIAGSGRLAGFGPVIMEGTLNTPGFIATGRAAGTLTLSNLRGSLVLRLTGPIQPGFSALPSILHYQIVSGTGAYAHDVGSGNLTITLGPSTPTGPPSLAHLGTGIVTLRFG